MNKRNTVARSEGWESEDIESDESDRRRDRKIEEESKYI